MTKSMRKILLSLFCATTVVALLLVVTLLDSSGFSQKVAFLVAAAVGLMAYATGRDLRRESPTVETRGRADQSGDPTTCNAPRG